MRLTFYLLQVRESFLRSIVSEPKNNNYVYAPTFDRLPQVTNVVLNNTCGVITTPPTIPTTQVYVNGKYTNTAQKASTFYFV